MADDQTTTATPEQNRLLARMERTEMPDGSVRRTMSSHVSWGPEAQNLSEEERAAVLNKVLDDSEAQEADVITVRWADAMIAYEGLRRALEIGRSTLAQITDDPPAVRKLKHDVFAALEMPTLHAGQMLPPADRLAVIAKISQERPGGNRG